MKYLTFALLAFCSMGSTAQPLSMQPLEQERARFDKAYSALRSGRVGKAKELIKGLEDYPLYPYFQYHRLQPTLHKLPDEAVQQFLAAYNDSLLAEKLRTEWLKTLARMNKWDRFVQYYRLQNSVALQCQHVRARIETGKLDGVSGDARALWVVGKSQPKECDPVFDYLYESELMNDELVWQRIRLALENRKSALARFLGRKLSSADGRQWAERFLAAHNNPVRELGQSYMRDAEPIAREIAVYAIARIARRDIQKALNYWRDLAPRADFSETQRGEMSRTLAIAAASRDFEDRINLLDAVAADYVDGAVDSYRLREGIEMRAWETLVKWTAREPRGDLGMLRWRYWRARALQETGRAKQALAIFADLAIQRDYYGFLSADRLGDDYRMNDRPIVVTATEEAEMSTRPGILRAHELYRLGMRFNARQEWHHEMKRMTPRELEVAARFAYGWGWYDRVIFALGKAKSYDDLELRFPLEYRELVGQYATKRDIESAVLFSIIRGESAFMSDARSPAGALGLMQLMPATGRETARRIGLKLRGARDLLDAKKNIMVGSAYLQSMLNRFDGSLPMAAAAYNAGPHRVRVWRPKQGCVPADIWIDTIPFTETRRYVRRSLFYAAVYQRRLEETIAPLSTRLAQITARNSESQC